jgi:endoribonuclease Dicer
MFQNILDHGNMSLSKISLLILDEVYDNLNQCHHAKSNHPYNQIMNVHYRSCPKDQRPKIFGMTASPVAQRLGAFEAIQALEETLCAEAITAPNLVELSQHLSRPVERFVEYDNGDFFPPPSRYIQISEKYPGLCA